MNTMTKNLILSPFNLLYRLAPRQELELMFFLKQRYPLHLEDPKTFNEKLQWIKLYDHNPLMPQCCDKFTVREFVKDMGCEDMLVDLLWEGYDPEQIPFDSLPDRFVVKVTHGSTFNIICTDKSKLDRADVIRKCKKWLKAKFLPCYGEWFYGKVRPRVIVEAFIESDDGQPLKDYKVFCFNGQPRYIGVYSDRGEALRKDIFTTQWENVPYAHEGPATEEGSISRPACLEQLLEAAACLAKPFLHARVDFYIVKNKILFGEVTFTSGAGFNRYASYDFDLEMGSCLQLPQKEGKGQA